MELPRLLFNLAIGGVWIYSGMILRFTKNKSQVQIKPYLIAKNYMITFLVFAGITIIFAATREKVLGEKLEYMCIYSLLNNFIKTILLFFSFISLYDCRRLNRYSLLLIYSPVFVLIFIYCVSRLVFPEPKIESFIGLLRNMQSAPPLAIKFLIILSIISGNLIVIYKYLKCKTNCMCSLGGHYLRFELDKVKWIDRMFFFIILMETSSILHYIITWYYYNYIHGIVMTVVAGYCTIGFINYNQGFRITAKKLGNTNSTTVCSQLEGGQNTSEQEPQETDSFEEIDEISYYVKKAIDKWVKNPNKPYLKTGITLKEAALGIGVSKRRLSGFIKNEYNCNFNVWISRFRIKEVERILSEEDPNLSLSYIADCVGFSDLPAMSNKFKKIVGISPSQYRRAIVQKHINDELANLQS